MRMLRYVALVHLLLLSPGLARAQTVTIVDPLSGMPIEVPPAPAAAAEHDAATHTAIGFLMAGHFADLATTMYVTGRGLEAEHRVPALKQYEQNPVRFALVKYAIAAGAVTTIFQLHKSKPKLARWLAYAEGAAAFAIAFRNQQLLDTTR